MNIGLLSLALAVAQPAPPGPPPLAAVGPIPGPMRGAAPLILPPDPFLFVTVTGPDGMRVTWQPGTDDAARTRGPVGLRPGYWHRFQITNLPDAPEAVLYPSLEVRGTLIPRPGLPDVSRHPVPISLTENDIDVVLAGRQITKVYYLEDPEQALPLPGRDGEALEGPAATEEEAIKEARARGRPMLILRVGGRTFTPDELAAENVPGTVYVLGDRVIPTPAARPRFPFNGVMVYDPILGPKVAEEECLKDGGDVRAPIGIGPGGGIGGLDPSDTAMRFATRHGLRVVPSNRIALCVPRFGAARAEIGLTGIHSIRAPEGHVAVRPTGALRTKHVTAAFVGAERLASLTGGTRISGIIGITGPAALAQWSGRPAGLSSIQGTAVVAQARGPEEITTYRGQALLLEKSADPAHPEKIGDVVTITLRFTNPTTEDMTDVLIADSLTARLEYVEGSSQTTRPATFTTAANEAGSVVLRWALDGTLKPGETGKITFQVRIK